MAVLALRARVSTLAVLAGLSFGITNLSVGPPNDGSFTKEVGSVTGQKLIAAHFAGGTVAPAEILASADRTDAVAVAVRAVGTPPPSSTATAWSAATTRWRSR